MTLKGRDALCYANRASVNGHISKTVRDRV